MSHSLGRFFVQCRLAPNEDSFTSSSSSCRSVTTGELPFFWSSPRFASEIAKVAFMHNRLFPQEQHEGRRRQRREHRFDLCGDLPPGR